MQAALKMGRRTILRFGWVVALAAGCGEPKFEYPTNQPIAFNDAAESRDGAPGIETLKFVDTAGASLELANYRGKKHVVLVVTRGYTGGICPYCTAQTSRLVANYEEFVKRGAEVLVVFPGAKENLPSFLQAVERQAGSGKKIPFPLLLDVDFTAVDALGIRGSLAKPSTYVLDREGNLRFGYVGRNDSDRPSVEALLKQLDALAG